MLKRIPIYLLLLFYVVVAVFTIVYFNGTGDAGDSIHHYLFARYAPVHPQLFFDHWAKPVYVLLAAPFAQFGFVGIKVFNALVVFFTLFLTCKIAEKLNLSNAIVASIILIFTPLYFVLTFSGLTEPLFALFITLGIYAVLRDKFILAAILISFLPFIRSEGLILLGVFGLYFLIKKRWIPVVFLLSGHVLYSIAGFFVYHDLLWVFNRIPYARLSSGYGSGKLFHFVDQLYYVAGLPVYILFWLGIIGIVWKSVKKQSNLEIQILILLGFIAFFVAHSLFWYFGIFNSMGLKRVLIGVAPLIALIALAGFNFLTEDITGGRKKAGTVIAVILLAYIVIFPFTSNPAAIKWDKDLDLTQDQLTAKKVADDILRDQGAGHLYVFSHPYLAMVLNVDYFNDRQHLELNENNIRHLQPGDIIIWENWFALIEDDIKKEDLDGDVDLEHLQDYSANDHGREVLYSVYKER